MRWFPSEDNRIAATWICNISTFVFGGATAFQRSTNVKQGKVSEVPSGKLGYQKFPWKIDRIQNPKTLVTKLPTVDVFCHVNCTNRKAEHWRNSRRESQGKIHVMDDTRPVIGYSNKVFTSINGTSSYVFHSVPSVYHSIYARELKKSNSMSRHVTGTV